MGWITTGTVNLVNGSNVVTGVGSKFLEDARIGDGFRGPNGMLYEVTNIPTNTSLTLRPNYEGATVNAAPYFLVPIEGYVKDSADKLRTATGQIALIPGGKQDKNDNLTALSGLTGAADRLPYFTGAGALSLGVLTAKARALLARTDSAGLRTELALGTAAVANVTRSNSSGASGQVLQFGDFGIGGTAPYLTSLDLNSFTSGGLFFCSGPVNGPSSFSGWLINSAIDSNYCSQIFTVLNTRDTYSRIKDGGTWSAWEILVNNRNAITDPGLNAGGIVFSGSNANGEYTKFADGRLICKFTSSTSVAMAGAVGNVWQSSASAFTFPATFISPPSVTPTTNESSNSICWSAILGAISVSSVAIGAQAPLSTATTKLGYIAVGRWKA